MNIEFYLRNICITFSVYVDIKKNVVHTEEILRSAVAIVSCVLNAVFFFIPDLKL